MFDIFHNYEVVPILKNKIIIYIYIYIYIFFYLELSPKVQINKLLMLWDKSIQYNNLDNLNLSFKININLL